MAHISGQSRYQATLFPEVADDLVSADHPVRVIDAFVDSLDLAQLGFSRVAAEATGRPPYAPDHLLKLYVYGVQNQVRSSRKLQREAERNVEVLWLIDRVKPSYKTIADFRKDHAKAIVGVCRAFTQFCRDQALIGGEVVAVDGTKVQAVASRKKVVTPKTLEKQAAAIERKIAEHLKAMDEADAQEEQAEKEPAERLDVKAALAALEEQRAEIQRRAEAMAKEGLSQQVIGEAEARLMRTPHHGPQVAYNAQIAVDAKHDLIVAFDLTSDGNDQGQLYPMAVKAKEALGADQLTVVADTGYSNGEHGALCEAAQIVAIAPRPETVNPKGEALFSRDAFAYDAENDLYRCPAGQVLELHRVSRSEQKKEYWNAAACRDCPLKPQCTKAEKRSIVRSFHEEAREAMHARARSDRRWMALRMSLVEHPIGTMKAMMGSARFLLRGSTKAKAEFALATLGYNLQRAINILGVPDMLAALRPAPA
ncbi:MAG TPA: IS1182 family transposase [Acetobacteraceae bacterium]|nr:IS1182 family transposase [Acetobacteraceae bacterium]